MNLKQINYLIELPLQRQKEILAWMVINKLNFVKKLLDSGWQEEQQKKLRILQEKIEELNIRPSLPEIEGVSKFSVSAYDLIELNKIETRLSDFIYEAERCKKIILKLRNQKIDEIERLTDG